MLESDEAARRLGVKVATLYAYVSRGLLASHPAPGGRRSLFALDDVERLARRSRQGKSVETRMATVTTGVTQLTDEGPLYRGLRATDLATAASFEEVAEWVWGGTTVPGGTEPPAPVRALDVPGPRVTAGDGLLRPPAVGGGDGRGPATGSGADLRPEVVKATARRVAASMVEALAPPAPSAPSRPEVAAGRSPTAARGRGALAARLAARLSPGSGPGPGPRGERRPGAAGRPRAGHLHHGGPGGRLHPGRPLRRHVGRPGHHRRTPPRWGQPAGLLATGGGPAPRCGTGRRRHPAVAAACSRASGTRSTSTVTPASSHCSGCSRSWPRPRTSSWFASLVDLAAEHACPAPQRGPGPGRHGVGHRDAPRRRADPVHRGPGGRMDGPLPRGAGGAAAALPGAGRLCRPGSDRARPGWPLRAAPRQDGPVAPTLLA